jgi:hypothetical protein
MDDVCDEAPIAGPGNETLHAGARDAPRRGLVARRPTPVSTDPASAMSRPDADAEARRGRRGEPEGDRPPDDKEGDPGGAAEAAA